MEKRFIFTVLRGEMLDIIFKIPISKLGNHDKLIWEPTANSRFTMKSAYHLEVRKKKEKQGNHHALQLRRERGGKSGV